MSPAAYAVTSTPRSVPPGYGQFSATATSAPSFQELVTQFETPIGLPLDVQEAGVEQRENASVYDITYVSSPGRRIAAYLVVPGGGIAVFGGLIYVHPALGSRDTFLEEAVTMADHGVVSLLVDMAWGKRSFWTSMYKEPQDDLADHAQLVVDLRRGVDLLRSRPEVDPQRIGLVGHSYGAMFGGILAGVEPRIQTFVLMAGTGKFVHMAQNVPRLQGEDLAAYERVMSAVDPIGYVAHSTQPVFYQFGEADVTLDVNDCRAFGEAGSEPKKVRWYPTGHDLDVEAARQDRLEWLEAQLDLLP